MRSGPIDHEHSKVFVLPVVTLLSPGGENVDYAMLIKLFGPSSEGEIQTGRVHWHQNRCAD